ncbi:hypothetical protein Acsp03_64320 [Actinomadura sp. NBRC 104412]|uniref:hypothetical protein n=1 Tax=Actinomadura sp. NBRC 104412 TaxID=3032203 RepID=UPI0024A167DB|nr:hypothetical protein [Actinomadura sp. NBRC 104412]GLZ08966.1 hypothetical protein Acsp03_64320 [Actinomadura sp. NBRC 104412]
MADDKRWKNHPIRDLLSRAAAGQHIYDDQIADLRLPDKIEKGFRQAAAHLAERAAAGENVTGWTGTGVDYYARELVTALPPEHETRLQHEERRAQEGDAQALANVKARQDAAERLADQVMNRARGAA